MKFICDQMLGRLGRWLRAAGYDTLIIEEFREDKEILEQAIIEDRILITRDRHILDLDPSQDRVQCLLSNSTKECVYELSQRLDINWLLKPFSRCLICNTVLNETHQPDISQIPDDIQKKNFQFWTCLKCGKVYWEGSHTKRMLKQLEAWQCMK